MPEERSIHKWAGWYASYTNDQGAALIYCQMDKIKQLQDLLELILGEVDLANKEHDPMTVLSSIEELIRQLPTVEHTKGYYKWVG